jgi:H+/Cl- antiporter ClcA
MGDIQIMFFVVIVILGFMVAIRLGKDGDFDEFDDSFSMIEMALLLVCVILVVTILVLAR